MCLSTADPSHHRTPLSGAQSNSRLPSSSSPKLTSLHRTREQLPPPSRGLSRTCSQEKGEAKSHTDTVTKVSACPALGTAQPGWDQLGQRVVVTRTAQGLADTAGTLDHNHPAHFKWDRTSLLRNISSGLSGSMGCRLKVCTPVSLGRPWESKVQAKACPVTVLKRRSPLTPPPKPLSSAELRTCSG